MASGVKLAVASGVDSRIADRAARIGRDEMIRLYGLVIRVLVCSLGGRKDIGEK